MVAPDEVVLVTRTAWFRVRSEGEYHEIESRQAIGMALRMLDNLDRHRSIELRHFAAQLGRFDIHRMDHNEVLTLIRNSIHDGNVIAVQKGAAKTQQPSATVQLRRLVAQVEKATRDKLAYRGRQYKLAVDVDLAGLPGRDYYEVASQSEARTALDGIAQESPASAEPVRQAREKLSKDWRPPLQPEGLVLLRRIPVHASAPKDDGPALTPSQLRKLREGWISLEVLDDFDRPWSGKVKIQLPDSSTRELVTDGEGATSADGFDPGNAVVSLLDLHETSWDKH
jgi:hypothetical protein